MGYIDDVSKILRMGPEAKAAIDAVNKKSFAQAANDSTLQFTCLIPTTIPIDKSSTIAKHLDRVYATFAQIVLSMNSTMDISIDRTPQQFLQKLHQNIKLESTDLDFSVTEGVMSVEDLRLTIESGEGVLYQSPDSDVSLLFSEGALNPVALAGFKRGMETYLSSFDTRPIPSTGTSSVHTEAPGDRTSSRGDNNLAIAKLLKPPTVSRNDLEKINDMVPYALQVRIMLTNADKEFVKFIDLVIGVKAVLHPMSSEELIHYTVSTLKNQNPVLNMVRWRSGEISFFKNILLKTDDVKSDISAANKGYSTWIPTLKRLKAKKVTFKGWSPKKIIPNATIIYSDYELEVLKNEYGYDLKNIIIAKKLMNELFLMTLYIYDEATGTISILYDNQGSFQTYAVETVERETALSSNKLSKEIGRMISK